MYTFICSDPRWAHSNRPKTFSPFSRSNSCKPFPHKTLFLSLFPLKKKSQNLINFPKVMTSENWSPLHVACINGKNDVVDLLLAYTFPRELWQKYRLEMKHGWPLIFLTENCCLNRITHAYELLHF